MKTYYELLEIEQSANGDDIKHAFRREIAKYHPDKVQHLGKEFQEIAALKASELTQAYKTLTDAGLRAEYDGNLAETRPESPPPPPPPRVPKPPPPTPFIVPPVEPIQDAAPPSSVLAGQFSQERNRVTEFILRAVVGRFRAALKREFGHYDEVPVTGFDATCVPKSSFWTRNLPPRVILRVVLAVDAAAITEAWALAGKMSKDPQRDLCVFVMGPTLAPAEELATAVAAQRRKPLTVGRKLIVVPVSTTDWKAHVPTDAPDVVRSLLARLQA